MQCGTMAMNQWCSHTSRSYDGNDFAWTGGQEFVYLITRGIQGQVAQFAVGELAYTFQVGFDTTKHRRSIDQRIGAVVMVVMVVVVVVATTQASTYFGVISGKNGKPLRSVI
jgi:hypothetical protein